MEHVKAGMHMPTVIVTYSPGGNIGNLHWIWHTTCTDISSALQSCQPILETIRSDIPHFHTRAMRQAAYEKYDLISPSIKKKVRHVQRPSGRFICCCHYLTIRVGWTCVCLFPSWRNQISLMIFVSSILVEHLCMTPSGRRLNNFLRKILEQWWMITYPYIRLQFLPRRKNTKTAEYYTGKLEVKRIVQQC